MGGRVDFEAQVDLKGIANISTVLTFISLVNVNQEQAGNVQGQHQVHLQEQQFDGHNWAAAEAQAFLEFQAVQDFRPPSNPTNTMIKCPMCKFEATSVANLNLHAKNFHPTQAEMKATQQLQGKLKKETVKCNICQRVLINDKRNLLDHCKLYHMNA